MSLSNAFENDLLLLLFNNTNIANMGDATGVRGSTAAGSLYISLHTADPGEAGVQNTSETSYTGYARVAAARSSAGWTVSGTAPTQVVNAATITFGTSTVGTPTITHFGVGLESSGATRLLASGVLDNSQVINIGGVNTFAAGALKITVD
jgi:hypothetical protein